MGQIQNPLHATPHGAGVANGRAAVFALQRQLAQALQRTAAGVARVAAGVLNGLRGVVRRRQLAAAHGGEGRAGVGALERVQCTLLVRPMMVNFATKQCHFYSQLNEAIPCEFEDAMAEPIRANMRKWVRITGEAEQEPQTRIIRSFKLAEIRELDPAVDVVPGLHPQPKKSFAELAAEQGVKLPQNIDEMFGAGRDLWDSDEDFQEFMDEMNRIRREDRERAMREFEAEQQ